MTESTSSDKEKEDFIKHINTFKLVLEKYNNKDKNFHENLLFDSLKNIQAYLSNKTKLYKILISYNWCKYAKDLLKSFIEQSEWHLVNIIGPFMVNFTDQSNLLCESLVEIDFGDLLIDAYQKAHDYNIDTTVKNDILITIISVIHNIARHVHLQQYFLRNPEINRFKQLILPLISIKNAEANILTIFVLTYLAKEDEQDKKILEEHTDIIKLIFISIKKSLAAKDRRYERWSLWELLLGLHSLSLIDTIKNQMILEKELLPTLISIMTTTTLDPKEVELSLGIVWNLSFVESIKDSLKSKYNIEKLVEPLKRSDSKAIRHSAKGLLWNLKKNLNDEIVTKTLKYDIFISYSHDQKTIVSNIEKELKKKFNVWIDTNNIKGPTLDDIALGIEQSSLFVMCISNSYKQSRFCRSEASYAYKIKKPIIPLIVEYKYKSDGWLGIIISSELYVDVSDNSKLTNSVTKLTEVINYKLKDTKTKTSLNKTTSVRRSSEKTKTVKEWSKSQVSQWLSKNELSHIQSKLEGFDGAMIDAIITMKSESPQIYYKSLEKKVKLTFPEILKFSAALSELNS